MRQLYFGPHCYMLRKKIFTFVQKNFQQILHSCIFWKTLLSTANRVSITILLSTGYCQEKLFRDLRVHSFLALINTESACRRIYLNSYVAVDDYFSSAQFRCSIPGLKCEAALALGHLSLAPIIM